MPTPTYTPLATTTLTSSAVDITFSNIPNTYRDLVLSCHAKTVTTGTVFRIYANGDSTAGSYAQVRVSGRQPNGVTAGATSSGSSIYITGQGYGTDPIYVLCDFIDYSSTDRGKIVLQRSVQDDDPFGDQAIDIRVHQYQNNNAINSLRIVDDNGPASWAVGSTFSLWGVSA